MGKLCCGMWQYETNKFVEKLGSKMRAASGQSRLMKLERSIAIQRSEVTCILRTLGAERFDYFYLL